MKTRKKYKNDKQNSDIALEELKKIIVVDVDWAAKVTISMLKERYNVTFEGDIYYESKYSDAFAYASYANGETIYNKNF